MNAISKHVGSKKILQKNYLQYKPGQEQCSIKYFSKNHISENNNAQIKIVKCYFVIGDKNETEQNE